MLTIRSLYFTGVQFRGQGLGGVRVQGFGFTKFINEHPRKLFSVSSSTTACSQIIPPQNTKPEHPKPREPPKKRGNQENGEQLNPLVL